jgi:hypothetical protein
MKPHWRDRLLIGIGLVFMLWVGLKIGRHFSSQGPRRMYDTPVLLQQVQTLSELVTVKYVVEKIEIWDDPPSGWRQFVAGDNRILLLARGVVKAGVDFSKLKPNDIKVQGKTIWINLPPARITDAYLDDKETKVIERTTGFLRSFDKDLEQNVRLTAVNDMRQSASRGGIVKDANDRARAQLVSFFRLMGFERVEFSEGTVAPPNFTGEERGTLIISNSLRDTAVPQNQPH